MKTIVVISPDIVFANRAEACLKESFRIVVFRNVQSALDYIFNAVPSLIVADLPSGDKATGAFINNLKEDPIFSQLPVVAVLHDRTSLPGLLSILVEDYVWKADLERELLMRARLSILRSERVVEINPLTRLPGNISINRQIEDRINRGDAFSFAYADIDAFKPFNDKYGFSRGDEVIKVTGRIILSMVKNRQPQGGFVGHVGGDDFVFITDIAVMEETAGEIVAAFDDLIPTFYDQEDREQGFIRSVDRRGKTRDFPIMGISIGITDTRCRRFSHYGELTETAAEMKKQAKQRRGSSFAVDQRRGNAPE
ncbi:MAG: response regulator PleD [Syntrophaceae bacterium PtaU1.Bin231]|nr:MAG: response regulator PleD [Syntrophaceae bacterium PtaU1.Bin231]HOG18709.1 diguanylate cyclase [Syntrophales bacterium]